MKHTGANVNKNQEQLLTGVKRPRKPNSDQAKEAKLAEPEKKDK